jgi:hypothetical protein
MLSAQEIARVTDRQYAAIWTPTKSCGCPFDRLFDSPIRISHVSEVQWIQPRFLSTYYPGPGRVQPGRPVDLLAVTDHDIYALSYTWLFQPSKYPGHAPLLERAAASFDLLQPVDVVRETVEAFKSQHFTPLTVGVHIRRGDYWRFSAVTVTPLDLFIKEIDKTVESYPDSAIFVATDDGAPADHTDEVIYEGVLDRLTARYGSRIVCTRPTSLVRSEPETVQAALVDLLLLRSTQRFIGNYCSSFSELAFVGRQVPYVLLGGPAVR